MRLFGQRPIIRERESGPSRRDKLPRKSQEGAGAPARRKVAPRSAVEGEHPPRFIIARALRAF